jgi:soluble lytic murein transglycosylase-like protein
MSSLSAKAVGFLHLCGLTQEKFLEICSQTLVPPELVLGIIKQESGGDAEAMRFEPSYRWLHEPEVWAQRMGWTADTERALQCFSYGLMQIMLSTARELGFAKQPHQLLSPVINLSWGCLYFGVLGKRHGDWTDAVSAYNQGSPKKKAFSSAYKNQDYVDSVLKYAEEYSRGAPPIA